MILIPVREDKGNLLIKMFLCAAEQKQATHRKLIKIVLSDIQTPLQLDTKIDTSIYNIASPLDRYRHEIDLRPVLLWFLHLNKIIWTKQINISFLYQSFSFQLLCNFICLYKIQKCMVTGVIEMIKTRRKQLNIYLSIYLSI